MTNAPQSGEQSALHGYHWQYDHIARLVYDAIVDSSFDSLTLASTDAGQVDDLLLFLNGSRHAIQYKGGVSKATVTFNDLVRPGTTPSGKKTDSLWRALANGWEKLESYDARPLTVHLAMTAGPSTSGNLTVAKSANGGPDHFRAFLARGLTPLTSGAAHRDELPEWSEPLERLEKESGLSRSEFTRFLPAVALELGLGDALDGASGTRADDILQLSQTLQRTVSQASGPVKLGRDDLLTLMNWKDRKSFRSVHEFPVDRATYSPLTGAAELLDKKLTGRESGFIAVTGAPGAGKSTLLSQTLSALPDRVVRYYAFVPGGSSVRSRLSAEWFLHDLSTMLRNAGLQTGQKELPGRTLHQLRQAVAEQFDAASAEYAATRRRTIVVVDGLDHVQRDYTGNDALTTELPKPADLPPGVIFLVGSRDLNPLSAEARQHIEDRRTEVNLEKQRLDKSAVIAICQRLEATRSLGPDVHALIADRSAGHPLSLVYLLARMEEYQGDHPAGYVRSVPQYDGDIAGQYRAVWESLDPHGEVERVLRVCSRLRIGFDLGWVGTWASDSAVRQFRSQLRYLFRVENGRWRFFHDSFRQFARERTCIGDDRTADEVVDREGHAEVADICEASPGTMYETQAVYHRFHANQPDAVLRLGTQARFRDQYLALRPATDILDDAQLVLTAAAQSADFPALLRGLLVLSEMSDRTSEMDEFDVCRVLLRSGLTERAIDYVGDEQTLRVPLAQAYGFAADLAAAGNPAADRVFRLFEHFGWREPDGPQGFTPDANLAAAWARSAAHFLPVETALLRMRTIVPARVDGRDREFERDYRSFVHMLGTYVRELGTLPTDQFDAINAVLVDELRLLDGRGVQPERQPRLRAMLFELQFQTLAAHLHEADAFEEGGRRYAKLRAELFQMRLNRATVLEFAMLEAEYGSAKDALTMLEHTGLDRALTLSTLGSAGAEGALDDHYDYWLLRHQLALSLGLLPLSFSSGPIASIAPKPETPAGDDVSSGAHLHQAGDAIRLAEQIDLLVRRAAFAQALVAAGVEVSDDEAWEALSVVITLFPPAGKGSLDHELRDLRSKRNALHLLAIDALDAVNPQLVARYERALSRRIAADPTYLPASVLMSVGVTLTELGTEPAWLAEALSHFEREATEQGVNSALTDLIDLIDAYADLGLQDEAARVCMRLWETSFGLGSYSDLQLAGWVQWLGRSAPNVTDLSAEAMWLTRVFVAADPLTDKELGAEYLPAALATASPRVALDSFEYLVAHGVIAHIAGMAELLTALITGHTPTADTILSAAEATSAIVAAAGTDSYPELAEALGERGGAATIDQLKEELLKVALPTTRDSWIRGVSLSSESSRNDDFGRLVMRDGSTLTRGQVAAQAVDLAAVRALLSAEKEDSHFDWLEILARNFDTFDRLDIVAAFADSQHHATVLMWAADRALSGGDATQAQRFAQAAYSLTPLTGWTLIGGALRRKAIRVLVATGAMTGADAAADFVRFVTEEHWFSSMLKTDAADVFDAIGADTTDPVYWDTIREYLDGLTENLSLPAPPADAPAIKWWLDEDVPGRRSATPLAPAAAVAELVVIHLTHPAWAVRDGSTQVVVSALKRGSREIAEALVRLVDTDPTDDVLETVAACIAAVGGPPEHTLTPVLSHIAAHPNFLIRRLLAPTADSRSLRTPRVLPGTYRLYLPARPTGDQDTQFGDYKAFLWPFEDRYRMLADLSGLGEDAILAMADRYATTALEALPTKLSARSALIAAHMQLSHPEPVILASRSAFGRVLGDLVDAAAIGPLTAGLEQLLRSGDTGMVGRRLNPAPSLLPPNPPAGYDRTPQMWSSEIAERMEEYIRAAHTGLGRLAGARSVVEVLNRPRLKETFACDLVLRGQPVGTPSYVVSTWISELGDALALDAQPDPASLLIHNNNETFLERRADWLAFSPALARTLNWRPDPNLVGGWRTATGRLAAATTIWTNGTCGRGALMPEDAVSEGCTAILTRDGFAELEELVGPLDLVLTVTRSDRGDTEPRATATRRVEL